MINAANNEGSIIVAAAGNLSGPVDAYYYPASYDNVLSVMAVDRDKRYGCSNCSGTGPYNENQILTQNDSVDIAAPGINRILLDPTSGFINSWNNINNGSCQSIQGYTTSGNGTSFSAPLVSGLIGLLLSEKNCLSSNDINYILNFSGEKISNLPVNQYFNNNYNTDVPLLDAHSAVNMASSYPNIIKENGAVEGQNFLCNGHATAYILENIPRSSIVNWNTSSNLTINSGQGTSSLSVQASNNGNGIAWIQPTVSVECGNATLDKYYIWIGVPSDVSIQPTYNSICKGEIVQFLAVDNTQYPSGVPSPFYEWTFPGGSPTIHYQSSNGDVIEVSYCDLGSETIRVQALNFCGSSAYASHNFNVNICGGSSNPCGGSGGSGDPGDPGGGGGPGEPGGGGCGGFICMNSINGSVSAYPVPTSNELNLEIIFAEQQLEKFRQENVNPYDFEISIQNVVNHTKNKVVGKIKDSKSSFNLTGLPPGVYMIILSGHGKTFRRSILIK